MSTLGGEAPIQTIDAGAVPQFDGQKFVAGVNAPNMSALSNAGAAWATRTAANAIAWQGVCYGNGIFVAVAQTGTANRVMTSVDGITWTARDTTGKDNQWRAVCFGKGLFVAVAQTGTNNSIMTSPDGINWTLRDTTGKDGQWQAVCYGNGLFVAVGFGTPYCVTSSDGINWSTQTFPLTTADGVAFGWVNGAPLFVASAYSGNYASSPDGATWTQRTPDANIGSAYNICWGNGLFVVISYAGTYRIGTSPDGINWTPRQGAAMTNWVNVCYGNGLFVAMAQNGYIETSPDGINWTLRYSPIGAAAAGCYGNGKFVVVGSSTAASSGGELTTILPSGIADGNVTSLVATNGGSATIPNSCMTYMLEPAALIATFTLTMPSAPVNGQIVNINAGSFGITALTLSPNGGQTFATGAAVTTLAASGKAAYIYWTSTATWYRAG